MTNIIVPVLVEFPFTAENWDAVVLEAKPNEGVKPRTPMSEQDFFHISYPNKKSWGDAHQRLDNKIGYKILNAPFSLT